MQESKALALFQRVRRLAADARRHDGLARTSSLPMLRDKATADYVRTVDQLVAAMAQLEELGVTAQLELYLMAAEPE